MAPICLHKARWGACYTRVFMLQQAQRTVACGVGPGDRHHASHHRHGNGSSMTATKAIVRLKAVQRGEAGGDASGLTGSMASC
jgi:predicted GIY-YIG superfamily endonuclease